MLLLVEVGMIVNCLISQTIYRVFLSKSMFTLHLIYGFLFVFLNSLLLLELEFNEGEVFLCVK